MDGGHFGAAILVQRDPIDRTRDVNPIQHVGQLKVTGKESGREE